MQGKICVLPLDYVINEPANQFDFQFENVLMFFSQYSLVQALIIYTKTNQVICIIVYVFLSKPWYINSEKKSSEKKIEWKKIDLTYHLPYFKLNKK